MQSKLDATAPYLQAALDMSEWPRNWPAAVQRVLEAVLKLPEAVMFAEPVVMDEAPGYSELIASPMDLGTVSGRAKADAYDTPLEALADVRQVLQIGKQAELQYALQAGLHDVKQAVLQYVKIACQYYTIPY